MSNSSHKNVVDMSKFDKLRAVSGASGVPLLNDCRDMAAAQLAQCAAAMLDVPYPAHPACRCSMTAATWQPRNWRNAPLPCWTRP